MINQPINRSIDWTIHGPSSLDVFSFLMRMTAHKLDYALSKSESVTWILEAENIIKEKKKNWKRFWKTKTDLHNNQFDCGYYRDRNRQWMAPLFPRTGVILHRRLYSVIRNQELLRNSPMQCLRREKNRNSLMKQINQSNKQTVDLPSNTVKISWNAMVENTA